MGDTFTVDPDELFDLTTQASSLAIAIGDQSLAGQVEALEGVSGPQCVADRHGDFVRHWSDNLAKLKNNLTSFSNRIGEAAGIYSATEHQIVEAEGGDWSKRDRTHHDPPAGAR